MSDFTTKYLTGKAIDTLKSKFREFFSDPGISNIGDIIRFEHEIDSIEPIVWLINQDADYKLFWSDRNGAYQLAGIGEADTISCNTLDEFKIKLNSCYKSLNSNDSGLKYFGGISFYKNGVRSREWSKFSNFRFHIPACEIYCKNGKTFFALNYKIKENAKTEDIICEVEKVFDDIEFNISGDLSDLPGIIKREDLTSGKAWEQKIGRIKNEIKNERIKKLVLAKKSVFQLENDLEPGLITYLLNKNKINSFTFYFQPGNDISFVGNSPELLYKRTGNKIISEALAGTRERGKTDEEDRKIEKELLSSIKDRGEHKIVQDYIEETLTLISKSSLKESRVTVLKLPKVQHLNCRISSVLKDEISDFDILSKLHPTPAVGGYPKEESLEKISEIEQFDRGWYGGAAGWIGRNNAEFAVGIRSGLISNSSMTLFAGAGIVEGSDPAEEWNESENKMLNFLRFFEFK
ncbi:isochorismate synthase MenF [candidate division KSB1 bacterium]